jgi:hypothetical protein
LEALCEWLGAPKVQSNFGRSAATRGSWAGRRQCQAPLPQAPAIRVRTHPIRDPGSARCV